MQVINLLFTGGFDSTFRLCQLSRMAGITVQPVYLYFSDPLGFDSRPNRDKEVQAQDAVLSALQAKRETKATLFTPIRVNEKDLPKDTAYEEAYEKWKDTGKIPAQYRLLGKLALLYPNLEIGREGPTLKHRQSGMKYGKTRQFLMDHGVLFQDHKDGSCSLNFKNAEPGLDLLFGRYRYPILGIPETDMLPFIHQWGYEDVFKHTWTCDFGGQEPCGVCPNCETKWASGIPHFFHGKAVRNHEVKKFLEQLDKTSCPSPVQFTCKAQLPEAFVTYVNNDYTYPTVNSLFDTPAALQEINYKFQKMKNQQIQIYFDSLVAAWDAGKKEEYLASLH